MSAGRTAPSGLLLALGSAATFGTAGSFAAGLLATGWTPAAAVTARLLIAALVLTVPAVLALRGGWRRLAVAGPTITVYGLLAVAGAQLCFFNAVTRLDVGVALLLEYLGSLLVVGWLWLRHHQRPRRLTVAGTAVAIVGLAMVLDVTGPVRLDPLGVLWGVGAAVGLAVYFVLSAGSDELVPPVVMAWAGMVVGSAVLLALGAVGLLHLHASTAPVTLLGRRVGVAVPVLGLALVAAAVAYVTGIRAAQLLGPKLAAFVGLTEVVFAVLFAWLLLSQLPRPLQIAGGAVVLAGVALVRLDELRATVPAARRPAEPATTAW